jgi:hypothetical protein
MSTLAMPVQIAIVNNAQISPAEFTEMTAALNEQIIRDVTPVWHVAATVVPYHMGMVPNAHTWMVTLQRGIDEAGAAGYHSDSNRQPYAVVDVTAGEASVTTSHEVIEMLVDPFGSRIHTAKPPMGFPGRGDAKGRVLYLVEACDPCEAFEYEVGGVPVSDFLTPQYYNSLVHKGKRYSFTGRLTMPRVVESGGYVSLMDPSDSNWYQCFVSQSGHSTWQNIGRFDSAAYGSLREYTDAMARVYRA